ncbi:hypothetical protein ACFW04_003744 [Cataglyphis niger]
MSLLTTLINHSLMLELLILIISETSYRSLRTLYSLLSGTLKTYQRAACDEEMMTLKCPPGTTILVEHAQYGRTGMHGISKCNSSAPPMIAGEDEPTNHTCIWPQSVQRVVGVCQKKRQCKFNTNPQTLQGDPCPGLRKYIEVAYKCRPYEFRSKVACENDVINLVCFPSQRVAIFSASFGRTQYESLQCPQPRGVQEEIPRSVLREQYEGEVEPDELELIPEFEEGFDRVDFRTEFSPSPNLEGPQPQPRDNVSRNLPTVSSSPPRARTNNDDNQEKFYLYIIVSVSAGILLFLGLVIGRLLVSRHRAKRDAKFHANNEALPNGFTDDISEIDADIDLTTPVAVPMQDARLSETQLAERLHGERYYADTRIPLSPTSIHVASVPHATNTGMRVDLGNHMVGTDNLHTILRTENPRSLNSKSYYYG